MNRRSFLAALGASFGAVACAPALDLAADFGVMPTPGYAFTWVTFKSIPVVFDRDVPNNRVYFVNRHSYPNVHTVIDLRDDGSAATA